MLQSCTLQVYMQASGNGNKLGIELGEHTDKIDISAFMD
jgi:hypothetical protein